jgi:hypothetical protein
MSSADEVDLGQLSQSEQSALQTYMTVTGQDPAAAIPLLRRSQWNVQVGWTPGVYNPTVSVLTSGRSYRSPFQSSLTAKAPILSRKLAPHLIPRRDLPA